MITGIQYRDGNARYIVDNKVNECVGRFNSLAKAKTLVRTMAEWKIYDTEVSAVVSSDDSKEYFANFTKDPEQYPSMNRCAKLFARLKKIGKKPVA